MLVNTSLQKEVKRENVDFFIKTRKEMKDLMSSCFVIIDPNHIGYFWYAPCKKRSNGKLDATAIEANNLLLAKIEYTEPSIKKPVSVKKALQG